jgi:hypothetical protein
MKNLELTKEQAMIELEKEIDSYTGVQLSFFKYMTEDLDRSITLEQFKKLS